VKVVLFCGGQGLRMREASQTLPKPMVPLGTRPILWHIMKYYASFGHTDFILCLGYKAEVIKEYFLTYNEALSNDFVLRDGGSRIELLQTDTHDWSITFVNTGLHSAIGERLRRVKPHLDGSELFLATYGDGLTDAPLPAMIETLADRDKTALFLCSRPTYNFHVASFDADNNVRDMMDVTESEIWINAGYFVFRREIFDYVYEGEELVDEPFQRLIADEKLIAYPYDGYWAPMDTLKDKQTLDALAESGRAPWSSPRGVGVDEIAAHPS
jgi:glucose-1-phosphate cytidylyltransferase